MGLKPGKASPQQQSEQLLGGEEEDGPNTQTRSNAFDTRLLEPKRAKRILANRQSAQRSRMKRLQVGAAGAGGHRAWH